MKFLKINYKNSIAKDIGKILGSSAIAQIVNFLSLPILAKIYSPEDVAKIGLAFSFINFFTVLSCLRFEMAIISTKVEEEVKQLFRLCMIFIFVTLPVFSIILFYLIKSHRFGFEYFNNPLNAILILVTLVFAAFILIFRNISIFFQQYTWVSTGTVIQQILASVLQAGFGLLHANFLSLIAGECLSRVFASYYFFRKLGDKLKIKVLRSELKHVFTKNRKFALYTTPSSFMENASGNVMIPFLFYVFTPVEVGCYTLIQKISAFPASALSRAIADVFHERFSKVKTNHRAFFIKFTRNLVAVSLLICAGMFVFYKFIFTHVFSEAWRPAMSIGLITIPWFGLQIAVGTLSRALFIFKKQDLKFIYDFSLIIFTMIIFVITKIYHLNIFWFFGLQTASKSIMYILYFFVIAKAVPNENT